MCDEQKLTGDDFQTPGCSRTIIWWWCSLNTDFLCFNVDCSLFNIILSFFLSKYCITQSLVYLLYHNHSIIKEVVKSTSFRGRGWAWGGLNTFSSLSLFSPFFFAIILPSFTHRRQKSFPFFLLSQSHNA